MAVETINGVSLDEYASACGNLTQGMSEQSILQVLGLEKPVWDETVNNWNVRLGELAREDMATLMRYGSVFANPREGRFANAASPAVSVDELLKIVPDLEACEKISVHQSVASKYGFDPVTILAQYGLDLGKWGSLNMHYLTVRNALLDTNSPDFQRKYQYYTTMHARWEQHFEQMYAASKVDLGKDIQF